MLADFLYKTKTYLPERPPRARSDTMSAARSTPELRSANILRARDLTAIVNPVNCAGITGKGLAAQFAARYPEIFPPYQRACRSSILTTDQPLIIPLSQPGPPRYVVNLATKRHWQNPSRIEWINAGLGAMYQQLQDLQIDSVGIPPLGAGLGRIPWPEVKNIIELHAARHPQVRTVIFTPRRY